MLIDGSSVAPDTVFRPQVCIVGAGPAGISLAQSLAEAGIETVLLEGGGREPRPDTTSLTDGETSGHPYFRLNETRARMFGGSSIFWHDDGWLRSRPMDPIDFEARSEIGRDGWPIGSTELERHYRAAQQFLSLGPYEYEPTGPGSSAFAALGSDTVHTRMFRFGTDQTIMHRYFDAIEKSRHVTLILNANAVELIREDNAVVSVQVAGLWNAAFEVQAQVFVLAAGGIENARLLLVSDRDSGGLGNHHDRVGRYFMEHLRVLSGQILLSGGSAPDLSFYRRHTEGEQTVIGVLGFKPETLRSNGMLNQVFYLSEARAIEGSDAFRSLAILKGRIRGKAKDGAPTRTHLQTLLRDPLTVARVIAERSGLVSGKRALLLTAQSEQTPNEHSRVTLSEELDPLGYPKPHLRWELDQLDIDSIRRGQEVLGRAFHEAKLGSLIRPLGTEHPPAPIRGNWHHMGTTRMSTTPEKGVVDRDSKVHGLVNLYVAGSSVFPTGGYANPTLTLVALANRLGEHLKRRLSPTTID